MFEPKFRPQLNERANALSDIRFGISLHTPSVISMDADTDPLHIHEYVEIFFNLSADVSFLVNNAVYPVLHGEAIVSRPGDVHMGIFHKHAAHEHVCLWIDADLHSPLFSFLQKAEFCPLFSFDDNAKQAAKEAVLGLLAATEKDGSQLEKTAYLLQILLLLEKSQNRVPAKPPLPAGLQSILDDIQQNFATIRGVNDILNTHFVSSSTLTRWFRKYLHSSPREYLESVRLSNASAMLQNGASVTDAGMRSGFSDCSRFILLFKKKFGETPLKYKKKVGIPPCAEGGDV